MLEAEELAQRAADCFQWQALTGQARTDHRRTDPGKHRPGALHHQPQLRQMGFAPAEAKPMRWRR